MIQPPGVKLGFELKDLLIQTKERQAWWQRLHAQIPSMESVPVLNTEALKFSNLRAEQKQRLQAMMSGSKTLNEIASALAQDSLEIAKIFAKLINEQLVTLAPPIAKATSEIVVVDDSPLLLKQFENLVANWGYQVQLFHDPSLALHTVTHSNPAVIFLDINMPDITGFDLVKQIRRQSHLTSVPIIMLTAEKTLTNNWRARWSGCRFLSKPLTPDEVPAFQMELRMLLAGLIPLEPQSQVNHRPGCQSESR
ncbi:MAG: response regulator [Leptolyngbyaceae cyanobacterium RU_5_1]|nr:response regulator [Leptolyngbyaceae cyanobacterium RU_5_1]